MGTPSPGNRVRFAGYAAVFDRPDTPTFTEVVPASGDLYANPAASQQTQILQGR